MIRATKDDMDMGNIKRDKTVDALRDEIRSLEAEKRILEKNVKRLREPSLFSGRLRKLMLPLEKDEAEVAELSIQVDLGDYLLDARRWIGLLQRYEQHIETALNGRKVIDISSHQSTD